MKHHFFSIIKCYTLRLKNFGLIDCGSLRNLEKKNLLFSNLFYYPIHFYWPTQKWFILENTSKGSTEKTTRLKQLNHITFWKTKKLFWPLFLPPFGTCNMWLLFLIIFLKQCFGLEQSQKRLYFNILSLFFENCSLKKFIVSSILWQKAIWSSLAAKHGDCLMCCVKPQSPSCATKIFSLPKIVSYFSIFHAWRENKIITLFFV